MCRARARPASVLRLVVNPAVTLVAVGVGIGVVMALGTSRLLVSFLVGVAPDEPVTFAAVSALMVAVAQKP